MNRSIRPGLRIAGGQAVRTTRMLPAWPWRRCAAGGRLDRPGELGPWQARRKSPPSREDQNAAAYVTGLHCPAA